MLVVKVLSMFIYEYIVEWLRVPTMDEILVRHRALKYYFMASNVFINEPQTFNQWVFLFGGILYPRAQT